MRKKIFSILIIFFVCTTNVFASKLNLTSEKYILYNMNDDEIIMEKKSNDQTYIASLTKIMTVIVAIENIDDYNESITITDEMLEGIEWDVAVAGFKVNDKVTYNDLLYGSILASGADAVNSLALSISNNYSDYIKMMNNKAKQLDLTHTHYANVTGLYNKNNYSSAYDIAKLLKYALSNKKFKEIFTSKSYTSTNGIKMKSTIDSYNKNVGNNDISYITGAKTGYIAKAGYCLATTATIDNVNYMLVTLNSFSNESSPHIRDAVNTYKYYSTHYSYQSIVTKEDVIVNLPTKYAREDTIDIYSNQEIKDYLKNDFIKSDVNFEYDGLKEVSYFTKKGTYLGKVKIMYKDKVLDEFDLIYNVTLTFSLFSFLWFNKYYILLLIVILLLIRKVKKYSRRKKRVRKIS